MQVSVPHTTVESPKRPTSKNVGEMGFLVIKDFIISISPYLLLLNTVLCIIVIQGNISKNSKLLEKNDDALYDLID